MKMNMWGNIWPSLRLVIFSAVLAMSTGMAIANDWLAASTSDSQLNSVVSLLHFDGGNGSAGFTDQMGHSYSAAAGMPTITTANTKWGTGALNLNGSSSILATSADFQLPGDFTYEAWIYTTATARQRIFSGGWLGDAGNIIIRLEPNNAISVYLGQDNLVTTETVGPNAWHHLAVSKAGKTVRVFIDGNLSTNVITSSQTGTLSTLYIGGVTNQGEWFNGMIDEVRLTKGVARYIASFSIPTAAYPDKAPVNLTSLTLNCPVTLTVGTVGNCSAIANYDNGSSTAASPTWTSLSSSVLTINANTGAITLGSVGSDTPVIVSAAYTEGGITKTATASVTVKSTAINLASIIITCPATVSSGTSGSCTAVASYSDNTSKSVNATWSSSNATVATMNGSTVASGTVTTDTPVSINASYTENGVTKTATAMVTVKATVATLVGLTAKCPATVNAGATATCSAEASYSNKTTKAVTAIWTSSNTAAAAMNGNTLVAGNITADTPVMLTIIYSENGATQTATTPVTVKFVPTNACSGSDYNLSGLTIAGNPTKKLGDPLEVNLCLKNFNAASKFDFYVAVRIPDGPLLFMQSAGFFGTPLFTPQVAPYLANTLIRDNSGSILSMMALPMDLPVGQYMFFTVTALPGKDVMDTKNWTGKLVQSSITITK